MVHMDAAAAATPDTAKSSPLASASASPSPSPLSPVSAATMATATASASARTRTRLHGFSFPTLSWGTHRLLRCSKNGASASPLTHAPSPGKEKPRDSAGAGASQPQRPWNLRIRRSATAEPLASRSEGARKAAAAAAAAAAPVLALQSPPPPPPQPPADARKRGFSVALTKEEIAEDFIAIRGARPPRRPKKRPRAVQRELDALFPGLLLGDVNLDSYKIDER